MQKFAPLLDNFFASLTHTTRDDGNVVTFSIMSADERLTRFAGEPLAERMANFIKRESKRLSKALTFAPNTETATKAIADVTAIMHSLDKYVENGTFHISDDDRKTLRMLVRLADKYGEMIYKGKFRSLKKADKETAERFKAEVEAIAHEEAIKEQQRKIKFHLKNKDSALKKAETAKTEEERQKYLKLADKHQQLADAREESVSHDDFLAARHKIAAQMAEGNAKEVVETMLNEAGNILERYLKAELQQRIDKLIKSIEVTRKGSKVLKGKMSADRYRRLKQITSLMNMSTRAKDNAIGDIEEARDEIQKASEEIQKARKALNSRGYLPRQGRNAMLDEIVTELQESGSKVTLEDIRKYINKRLKEVSARREAAKEIRDKKAKKDEFEELQEQRAQLMLALNSILPPAETNEKLDSIIETLGENATRDAVTEALDAEEAAITEQAKARKQELLNTIALAKQIIKDEKAPKGAVKKLLDEITATLGENATQEEILAALENRELDINIFGDFANMTYAQAKVAAEALESFLVAGRTAWEAKQHAKRMRIVRLLRDFFAATENKNLGEVQAHLDIAPNEAKLADLSPDSLMNPYQLFLALSSFEGLKPIFEPLMYDLAKARIAREVHLSQKLREEREAIAKILGIQPKNGVSYTKEDLKEVINKFDDLFVTWNKVENTGITTTRQENLGYSTQEEAELEGKTLPKEERGRATQTSTAKLELTRWEAAHLVLMYRQKDYKKNAEANGITEDVLSKLEDFCGSQLLAVMDYLQKAIANDGTVQEVEARTGAPMRENEKYFPARANIKALDPKGTKVEGISLLQVNPFEWMRERVSHTEQLEPYNAYTVYRTALASRANYVFFEPITETLEKLLSNKAFANRLYSLIGENLYRQLILTIGEIKNASWQETVMQDIGTTKLQRFFDTSVALLLSGNPSSYVRQITAANNAGLMPGINPVTAIKYLKLIKKGKAKASCSEIAELNAIKTRYRDNAFVNELIRLGRNASFSRMFNLARTGLDVMEKIDIFSNTIAATIVYNQKYDQLTKEGNLTEEEILKRCEQEVELYVALLAQPLSRLDKSAAYWIISQHAIGRSLMYMGSENINKAGHLRALYIMNKNQPSPYLEKFPKLKKWVEGSKLNSAIYSLLATAGVSIATIGIARFAVELFIAAMTGDTPDEDDSYLAWLTAMFTYANLSTYVDSMPALSSFISPFVSMYTHRNGKLNIPGVGIFNTAPKIWEMCTDDKDYSPAEWEIATTRFLRDFTAWSALLGGYYSGIPYVAPIASTLASTTAATNLLYPFARGARNEAWWTDLLPEPLTEWLTESDTRKPSRRKMWLERKLTPSED
jgi:hypothetical protein